MNRLLFRCLLAGFLCIPTVVAGQSSPEQPATTLHATTNLVVEDVVVTDAQQRPVRHLKASDFTLLEDGHAQAIKVFEEHSAGEPAQLPPAPRGGPGVFTNRLPFASTGPLNIILLDKLNTPVDNQPYVRDQLLKYLKQPHPGSRTAIFGLTTQLHLLQGFTSDPEVLRAAVAGNRAGPKNSPLLHDPASGDAPGAQDSLSEDIIGNTPSAVVVRANLQQFVADLGYYQLQLRVRYTLEGFNQLGRYLSRLPGRKNLIWFSGSFPVSIHPDENSNNPFKAATDLQGEFRDTVDLLARSQVAVYPVDARGVIVSSNVDASVSGREYATEPGAFGHDQATFAMQTADEQQTMMRMADSTGGKAYTNTNNLAEAVEKVVEAGSNYYTLAYSPTNSEWKGEFRKIRISLAQGGLKTAYRPGYFADDPLAPVRRGVSNAPAPGEVPFDPMRAAMMWGAPGPTEILFQASVQPASAGNEPALTQGNQSNGTVRGPYRRFAVSFSAQTADIQFNVTPDGFYHCALAFATYVYDSDGKPITSQGNTIKCDIPAAHFASVESSGIHFKQEISVPVKGEYFLRIGIQDLNSSHVGAVELPVFAVSKLAPLAADGAAPAPVSAPR